MIKRKTFGPTISGAFVFLLLGLFAVLSTALVLFGAQAYRGTIDRAQVHSDHRILVSYVRNMVRAADSDGKISVCQIDGVPVLMVQDDGLYDENGSPYVTCIYAEGGKLREAYTSVPGTLRLENGEELCAARSFEPKIENGLLCVEAEDENGIRYREVIALRSRR